MFFLRVCPTEFCFAGSLPSIATPPDQDPAIVRKQCPRSERGGAPPPRCAIRRHAARSPVESGPRISRCETRRRCKKRNESEARRRQPFPRKSEARDNDARRGAAFPRTSDAFRPCPSMMPPRPSAPTPSPRTSTSSQGSSASYGRRRARRSPRRRGTRSSTTSS